MAITWNKNRFFKGILLPLFFALAVLLPARWVPAALPSDDATTTYEAAAINASGNANIALSVDPVRKSEGYATVLYDIGNGLPASEANAIAQTSDGFLWIGCYAGLIRYDGSKFERIDSTSGISGVRCLYVDSQDRLWIGTNDAGLFLMTKDGFRNWNKADGLESVSIRSVTEDEDGTILFGSTAGMAMIDSSMNLSVLKDKWIADQTIKELRKGADGLIYGLTQNGDLFSMEDGRVLSFLGHEECRVKGILSILPDPAHPGDLYLGTAESQVYYGSFEENFPIIGVKDIAPLNNTESFEAIDGDIWICSGNGIGKIDSLGFCRLQNVPMNSSVGHVMTDYEGNLWFTSTRQGIMKIVPNQFSDLFERYGLPAAVVNTTCMVGRQLFIGTDTGLIVVEEGKTLDSYPLDEAVTASGKKLAVPDLLTFLKDVRIRSVIQDRKERLWISTWHGPGILRVDQGKLTVFTQEDGLFSDQIRMLSECEDGSLLAANSGGVCVIRENQVAEAYGEKDGIYNTEILTVTEGFHHEIVLGSDGGGIFVIDEDGTRHIGTNEGLGSEVILRIRRSPFREIYWIVTSNSLAFMTSDFQVTTVGHFPYPNNYDLYENSKGDVWVLCSSGIYVTSEETLLKNEEIDPVFLGIGSGLPYVATANSFSGKTEEGDLYMAGSEGVVKVNMEKPFDDIGDMKVSLPFIDADGRRYYPDEQGSFTLPGIIHKVTVYPYVFNYSLQDPQVSYRLKGFDLADTTVNLSRLLPVDYTNLGFGAFDFIITVKDSVGMDEQTVSFRIVHGKEITVGTAGSLIMIFASLLLMAGIIVYTAPYRNRKRLDDRLRFGMLLSNIALAVGELLSYLLEYLTFPLARAMMMVGNTVYYIFLVFFPYLFCLYLDYRIDPDTVRTRKRKLLYGIPCFFFLALMLINIKTGWVFTITEDSVFKFNLQGKENLLLEFPLAFYAVLSMLRVYRINKRLVIIDIFLIATQLVWDFFVQNISSTSFVYTMVLVCIHLYVMYQPMKETNFVP